MPIIAQNWLSLCTWLVCRVIDTKEDKVHKETVVSPTLRSRSSHTNAESAEKEPEIRHKRGFKAGLSRIHTTTRKKKQKMHESRWSLITHRKSKYANCSREHPRKRQGIMPTATLTIPGKDSSNDPRKTQNMITCAVEP